jgi:hypothetical protein
LASRNWQAAIGKPQLASRNWQAAIGKPQLASRNWQADLFGTESSAALALELRARSARNLEGSESPERGRASGRAGAIAAHSANENFLELNFNIFVRLLMLCRCGSSRHRLKLFQPQFTIRPALFVDALWEISPDSVRFRFARSNRELATTETDIR